MGPSRTHDLFVILKAGDTMKVINVDFFHLQLLQAFMDFIVNPLGLHGRFRGKNNGSIYSLKGQPDPVFAVGVSTGRVKKVHPHFDDGPDHSNPLLFTHPLDRNSTPSQPRYFEIRLPESDFFHRPPSSLSF